jgi:hypothetical protein
MLLFLFFSFFFFFFRSLPAFSPFFHARVMPVYSSCGFSVAACSTWMRFGEQERAYRSRRKERRRQPINQKIVTEK